MVDEEVEPLFAFNGKNLQDRNGVRNCKTLSRTDPNIGAKRNVRNFCHGEFGTMFFPQKKEENVNLASFALNVTSFPFKCMVCVRGAGGGGNVSLFKNN